MSRIQERFRKHSLKVVVTHNKHREVSRGVTGGIRNGGVSYPNQACAAVTGVAV